jgi:hypothetical protein
MRGKREGRKNTEEKDKAKWKRMKERNIVKENKWAVKPIER